MTEALRLPTLAAAALAFALTARAQQPVGAGIMPLNDLKRGEIGEVWTVFEGSKPESFKVEVAGVVRNALGPGKSMILCRMTDPRVQKMGAVAGMSGSPMYIDGKLVGALSYQVTPFETEQFAGFTPAADLAEVGSRADAAPASGGDMQALMSSRAGDAMAATSYQPIRPAFTVSGISPMVASLMQPLFRSVGLESVALGGSSDGSDPGMATGALQPGDAVSVALATGDVTLAGTGTVSRVDGSRIVAFGHPMLSLGDVELPMCKAEIVTIIPSALESIKVANTGPMIGTITQDRLSAVSGTMGKLPPMIDIDVHVDSSHPRELHFKVARQQQLSPMLIAAGLSQAIVGSNDAGLNNGFRITSDIVFSPAQNLATRSLYAGPQSFALGVTEFVKGLSQDLQNPYEKTFPSRVTFNVEPLAQNPAVTLDLFQLSRSNVRPGESVTAQIGWRDYQGEEHLKTVAIAVPEAWSGKSLEVVLAPGPALDEMAGRPRLIAAAQLRSFDAYLAAMREDRSTDGLFLAVVEASAVFTDQTTTTPELPGSLARIAAAADEARFQQRPALLPLWEEHVLEGKLANTVVRRPLKIVE